MGDDEGVSPSEDDRDEPELTPEQRERFVRQLGGIHDILKPMANFKPPELLRSSTLSTITSDMARLRGFAVPESMLKGFAGMSLIAEQNSRILDQLKPVFDVQSAWSQHLPRISSDILKLSGIGQVQLSLLSTQLAKSADFGWQSGFAKIAEQYATQQANWLAHITPALTDYEGNFYPTNLRDIEAPKLEDVEQVVMLDGIALYEVPRAEIAGRLVRAPSSAARREILGRKWKEIAADCRAALTPCQTAEVAPLLKHAIHALDALEIGNPAAAQALAGNLVDTILRTYLPKTKPLIVPSKKTKNADAYLDFSVRKYIALAPIWQAYQHYFPDNGDPIPRPFNRHATAHTVSTQQYSRRNAVQGLMLVCGLLRFLDEQA